jgi:hypothetical protein
VNLAYKFRAVTNDHLRKTISNPLILCSPALSAIAGCPDPPTRPHLLGGRSYNSHLTISPEPRWPNFLLKTIGPGKHILLWTIQWKGYKRSGSETTSNDEWNTEPIIADLGGQLFVDEKDDQDEAVTCVNILGLNPTPPTIESYVNSMPDTKGFSNILSHESGMQHFTALGEPIVSRDNGYGIAQLTDPPPSFEEVWNWKKNVKSGIDLYFRKGIVAKRYLSQHNQVYTSEQLSHETVALWNGGNYYIWDDVAGSWRRQPILCDSATSNIGWDMRDPANKGLTQQKLHSRDAAAYSQLSAGDHWQHYGVCYADKMLRV